MAAEESHGALEVSEDEHFQRRQLLVARGAVAAFVVFIVLGLLGRLGSGPLSHATAGDRGSAFSVEYQRYLRVNEDTGVEVRLRGGQGTTELTLDQSFLDGFDFGGVLPEPDRQITRGEQVVFTFEDESPSSVTLSLMPQKIGLQHGRVSVDGSRPVSFSQFVYP